jgi:hypothetical protein
MTRRMILSDRLKRLADGPQRSFLSRFTSTSARARGGDATSRRGHARHTARDLPSLWSPYLSLRQRRRAWPEALSLGQSAQRPSSPGLCAQCRRRAHCTLHQQFRESARIARPDLCDQHGTFAATRRSWIDDHDHYTCPVRFCPGGCNTSRHGLCLSRCFTAACCRGDDR